MTVAPTPEQRQAADIYAATFAGRHDAYAIWTGESWARVNQTLDGGMVLRAFQTGIPISGYFLDLDSMTHVAALDIDLEDGYEQGKTFLRYLTSIGGIGYLEGSRRGAHVWIILDQSRPAITVRLALKAMIAAAGLGKCPGAGKAPVPHPKTNNPVCPACFSSASRVKVVPEHFDPRFEIRPGSDRLGSPKEGEPPPVDKCLRMPTMPHPATGKRYILVSSDGEKLGGKLTEFVPQIDLCYATIFDEAAERAPLPKIAPPNDLARAFAQQEEDEVSASDLLRDLWGATGRLIPGRGTKCPAHDDSRPTLLIFRDDRRVLCYSAACVLNNDGHGRGTRELRSLAPRKHA